MSVSTAGRFKGLTRHLPALLGVVLLVGAIYVVQKEFRHLKFSEIVEALSTIPTNALVFSFVWTILSYFILTFYDRLGTIYAGHKVSYRRVAFASFCAYSLSHNLGFAAVSGAAVRFRLYAHWGLTPLQIGKTVAFCSFTFGLGGLVLGGFVLFLEPREIPFFGQQFPPAVLYVIAAGMWAVVLAYVSLSRVLGTFRLFGHEIDLPGWRMAILQVLLATVDVAVTAMIFHALLPPAEGLTWLVFLGVYLASYTAGLAANLPGGIGVFDTVMLFGLQHHVDAPHIVGAIVVFRLFYYIIPLFLAGTMFAGNEILLRGAALRSATRAGSVPAIGRWSEPDFAVAAATGAVALCGIVMLSLSILVPPPDVSWIDADVVDIVSRAGQFIPSLIGAGLLLMAIGLSHRVNLAWGLTVVLLAGGVAYAATQGGLLWVSGMLGVTILLLAPFRRCFYRHASLLSGPLQASSALPLIALLICLIGLAAMRRQTLALDNNAWWAVILSPDASVALRATIALSVILALTALWLLIRPGKVRVAAWGDAERARFLRLAGVSPTRADGIVFGEADRAGIAFRRVGRLLVGLGDPAGPHDDQVSAIWRFNDLARQEGLGPAVWRAGPGLLKVYADLGMTALPLGADGLPLPETPDMTPPAEHYLVGVPERDLSALLPLLEELARERAVAAPAAA